MLALDTVAAVEPDQLEAVMPEVSVAMMKPQ